MIVSCVEAQESTEVEDFVPLIVGVLKDVLWDGA
jgi:hypothetical protein